MYATDRLARGVVGIGWDFDGADIAAMGREQIREAYASDHPSESKQRVAANVGQVYRFARSMTQGSAVVMYDPAERLYHMGEVAGPCVAAGEPETVTYTRAVKWGRTAPRDALAPESRNSLGGIQTIFSVSDAVMADLESASGGRPSCEPAAPEDDAVSDEESLAATYDNGIELIKDRVGQLDWEDMERLVAGLLRAMGYCAHIMPKGPDGGRDVVASPDALGLPLGWRARASWPRSSIARAPWELPRFDRSSADCARATVGFTSQRAASPRRRATRPTAPTSPFVCSTLTPSCVTTSRSMIRLMTTPAPSSHSLVSAGRRRQPYE